MQQPFLLKSSDRIRHWKSFRDSLDNISEEDQLLMTMKYWNQFPLVNRCIDPYSPENWPTPWELIDESCCCNYSRAYMMKETLLLTADKRWSNDRLKLKYIIDEKLSDEFIILVADNKYVINYDLDRIIQFDFIVKNCIIRHEYYVEDKIHCII